jgi:tetratricopeptide (TPR) repeat protein
MLRTIVLLGFLVPLTACATRGFHARDVSPAEIPALEEVRAAGDADAMVLARLGVAYDAAGRPADARSTLEEAVRLPDAPPSAWAYLGALAERGGDLAAAEAAYVRAAESGSRDIRRAASARLTAVRRQLLVQEARQALAREAQLALEPPQPRTVAVMPLLVTGSDEYDALGRGLAEMLITDLSVTGRIQVLERARLQALLDEMQLGLAGYTEPATAARAGRLLRAERVVQGRLDIPDAARAELHSVLVSSAQPEDLRSSSREGSLDALLQLQLDLALSIYRDLGIELTPVELARLQERPTMNMQAFLAYSRGLVAMDRGQFSQAASEFRGAAQLDPAFNAASEAAVAAEDMGQAAATPESMAEVALAGAAEETAGAAADAADAAGAVGATLEGLLGPAGALGATSTTQPPAHRPDQSRVGEDATTPTGSARITVRRPTAHRAPGANP